MTREEDSRRNQKINAHVEQLNRVQEIAIAERRHEIKRRGGDENLKQQQGGRKAVHGCKFQPKRCAPLGEDKSEMYEQRGLQENRNHVPPIDGPVKRIQFSGVMKTEEHEGHEAENIKVNGARRVPPAHKNKKTDEEIKQRRDSEVVLNRGVFLRHGDERHFE